MPELQEIYRETLPHTKPVDPITIGPVRLCPRIETIGQAQWLNYYFKPFRSQKGSDEGEVTTQWDTSLLGHDGLFYGLLRYLEEEFSDRQERQSFRGSRLHYYALTDMLTAAIQPGRGAAWVLDRANHKATFLYATTCPDVNTLHARTLEELAYRSLENQEWFSYHAGACRIGDKTCFVVGNANAGKTTFLMAASQMGAAYISNERTYGRAMETNGFEALGHPQPINVRASAGYAFPAFADLVQNYDQLAFKQSLSNRQRLQSASPDEWQSMDDKLVLFPWELSKALDAEPAIPGGSVNMIIVPESHRKPVTPALTPLDREELEPIIDKNRIRTSITKGSRPDWLRLSNKSHQEIPKSLLNLPAWRLRFHVSEGCIAGVQDLAHWLAERSR